jgi:hypothetical protein
MNKPVRLSLIVLITVGLLMALTVQGLAEKPEVPGHPDTFYLTYDFPEVDWDYRYAEGTFELYVFDGRTASGSAVLHWIPKYGTKHGTMIFTADDDEESKAVITFKLSKGEEGNCLSGPVSIPFFGTGVFEYFQGRGDILMCQDGPDRLYGEISGWAGVWPGPK